MNTRHYKSNGPLSTRTVASLLLVVFITMMNMSMIYAASSSQWIGWGLNDQYQLNQTTSGLISPTSFPYVNSISAGMRHTVAISSSQRLVAWGDNSYGQLGQGSLVSSTQVSVNTSLSFVQVSCGEYHTIALSSSGTVYSWGLNMDGQVGLNSTLHQDIVKSPFQVDVGNGTFGWNHNVTQVAAGANHSLALDSEGVVFSWGSNDRKQLGRDIIFDEGIPESIDIFLPVVKQIAAGASHSVALSESGEVYVWGDNSKYQLGSASPSVQIYPTKLSSGALSGQVISKIVAGNSFTACLTQDGKVILWGSAFNYQTPTLLSVSWTATNIFAGRSDQLFIATSVALYGMGSNDPDGAIFIGSASVDTTSTPVMVATQGGLSAMAIGAKFSYAASQVFFKALSINPTQGLANVQEFRTTLDVLSATDGVSGQYQLTNTATGSSSSVSLTSCNGLNCGFIVQSVGNYTLSVILTRNGQSYSFPKSGLTTPVQLSVTAAQEFTNMTITDDLLKLLSNNTQSVLDTLTSTDAKKAFVDALVTKIVPNATDLAGSSLALSSLSAVSSNTQLMSPTACQTLLTNLVQYSEGLLSSLPKNASTAVIESISTSLVKIASNAMDVIGSDTVSQKQMTMLENTLSIFSSSISTPGTEKRIATANFVMTIVKPNPAASDYIVVDADETTFNRFKVSTRSYQGLSQSVLGALRYQKPPSFSWTYVGPTRTRSLLETNGTALNSTTSSNSTTTILGSVLASRPIEFRAIQNGAKVKLTNLDPPIEISFSTNDNTLADVYQNLLKQVANSSASPLGTYSTIVQCRYYDTDTNTWLSDGCSQVSVNVSTTNVIPSCNCSHTTMFSAFLEYHFVADLSPEAIQSMNAVKGAEIALSSVYIIVIPFILIPLAVLFRRQPVTSRSVVPFIGLPAILIESIFVGIISSAVYIASPTQAPTGIQAWEIVLNVAALVTSVLILIAIFVYFVQTLRYVICRHMYEILSVATKDSSTIKNIIQDNKIRLWWYRLLVSKKVLSITLTIGAILFSAYFILFIILIRTSVISAAAYTYVTSMTVFFLIMGMTGLIAGVFIMDLILTKKYSQMSNQKLPSDTVANAPTAAAQKKKFKPTEAVQPLKHFFGTDDALKFRIEMVVYFFSILCFLISYIMGFSSINSRYESTSAASIYANMLDGIRLIFQFGFIMGLIMVFGGVTLITTVYNVVVGRKLAVKNTVDKLVALVDDNNGFELFKQFCKQEFSTENLYSFIELREMKGLMLDKDALYEKGKTINERYFKDGVEYEVNLPHATKVKFDQLIVDVKDDKVTRESLQTVLDSTLTQVALNLQDTMSRFVSTDPYARFEAAAVMATELQMSHDVLGVDM